MKIFLAILFVIGFYAPFSYSQEQGEWIFLNSAQDSAVYEEDGWIWGYSGSASRFHEGEPRPGHLRPVIFSPGYGFEIELMFRFQMSPYGFSDTTSYYNPYQFIPPHYLHPRKPIHRHWSRPPYRPYYREK